MTVAAVDGKDGAASVISSVLSELSARPEDAGLTWRLRRVEYPYRKGILFQCHLSTLVRFLANRFKSRRAVRDNQGCGCWNMRYFFAQMKRSSVQVPPANNCCETLGIKVYAPREAIPGTVCHWRSHRVRKSHHCETHNQGRT